MAELLFSLTAKDFEFTYARGSGKGGQKRNKTETAVRCKHPESGAVGFSDDTRSQHQNKQIAFRRMAESKEFKDWHTIECAKRMGEDVKIKEKVEEWLKPQYIKEETYSA